MNIYHLGLLLAFFGLLCGVLVPLAASCFLYLKERRWVHFMLPQASTSALEARLWKVVAMAFRLSLLAAVLVVVIRALY